MLSFRLKLAGRYALVILHLHKQAYYCNMMECCVFLPPYLLFMGRRNAPEIKACNSAQLMFIVRLSCLETFDKQRVARRERREKKVSEDLAGACQNNTPFSGGYRVKMPPRTDSYFTARTSGFAVWAQ